MTHIVMTEIGEGDERIVLTNRLTEEQMNLYNKLSIESPKLTAHKIVKEVFKQIPKNKNVDSKA